MPDLYLGIDGGGTKTHAAVMDASGQVIGFAVGETGNPERVGIAGAVEVVQKLIDRALQRSGARHADVLAATFALAGVDWDTDAAALASAGKGFGLNCLPNIVNDAIAVLFAGTHDGVGCASVAGTGGKTVAQDGYTTVLTLGVGIGEAGGAEQIVTEMLTILARVHHGQRQPSALQDAVLAAASVPDVSELFRVIVRDGWHVPAAFAPTVFELAADRDVLALEAVETVARQHAADVAGLADQLDFSGREVPVVCAGGLHTANSAAFREAFEGGLEQSRWPLSPVVLAAPPVAGALSHAFILSEGAITNRQRSQLLESAQRLAAE